MRSISTQGDASCLCRPLELCTCSTHQHRLVSVCTYLGRSRSLSALHSAHRVNDTAFRLDHDCVAGANFFNLSPLSTDGKYLKKAVTMMLHMVFKVAKTMSPSVIFIKDADKVFLTDKKKVKEIGGIEPCNRIKKDLLKVCASGLAGSVWACRV